MKIEIKQIPTLINEYFKKVLVHAKFIFIIVILGLNGFLVFEINRLTSQDPTSEEITQQMEIIKRPKLDQETVDKLKQLEDQNVAAKSLFKAARDNPFQD